MEENQQTNVAQPAPCEQATQPVQPAKPVELAPNSHLVWAILCTVFCCLPLGIVAIVKAASVDALWVQGRKEEAKKAAKSARNFSLWGTVLSIVCYLLFFLIYFLGIVLAGVTVGAADLMSL